MSELTEETSHCSNKAESEHQVQLQLFDVYGIPVPNTSFWITITILKNGDKVTLQLPTINFQTGQFANASFEPTPPFNAGYLYTVGGFLPKEFRPNDIENRSWLAASNNGMSEAFSFTQDPSTLPVPVAGYIVQVTNAGGLVVQAAGTFGNSIASGPQVMLPTIINYIIKPKIKLGHNTTISTGFTDTTHFTNPNSADNGIRDTHINDAFSGVVATAWTSNSTVPDKTNGTMNLMVSIGKVNDGRLEMGKPVQLTNFPPNVQAWDTSIAINRINKNVIVVSYGILDLSAFSFPSARAVSFDGGKTWPAPYVYTSFTGYITGNVLTVTSLTNGTIEVGQIIYTYTSLVNILVGTQITALGTGTGGVGTYIVNLSQNVPSTYIIASLQLNGILQLQTTPGSLGFGDNPGVQADKFGNFWYMSTILLDPSGNFTNTPYLALSSDQGITFNVVYVLPEPDFANGFDYGFPEYCFGGDGQGNYGIWIHTDYASAMTLDNIAMVTFVPILGLGSINLAGVTSANLPQFLNNLSVCSLTASAEGRLWLTGWTAGFGPTFFPAPMTTVTSMRTVFKSPGPINSNYVGPWDFNIANYADYILFSGQDNSQPIFAYFNSFRTAVYDDKRQALYQTSIGHFPDQGQNMRLYFAISRNNGQTWSQPIDISNSDLGNRGFQSIALDPISGNLIISWYDGRNGGPEFARVEYFGAVITACELDKLVEKIPLSNPVYSIPPTTTILPQPKIKLSKEHKMVTGRRRYKNRLPSEPRFFNQ